MDATQPDAMSRPSVFGAVSQAVEHVRTHLFPFDVQRWLALGFLALLDQCGRGGGGIPSPGGGGSGPGGGGGTGPDLDAIFAWIQAHIAIMAAIGALVLLVAFAITALVLWIGSRGIFMYMDNVATGRTDIVRPWKEHAPLARSLFLWRLIIALITWGVILVLVGMGVVTFVSAFKGGFHFSVAFVVEVVVLAVLFLCVAVASNLMSLALRDFVAPIQLVLRSGCGEAFRAFLPLVKENAASFAGYVLLKVAFNVALGLATMLVGCLTCCIAFLPVIAQAVLQPLLYFERAWSLCLLRQLGYDLLPGKAEAQEPAAV